MPYAGEHSCRIAPPSQFEEFRRQNNWKTIDGKRVDAIWGINGEGTNLQALRYPKGDWSIADARAHCSGQEGILFEPASSPQIREGGMAHRTKFVRPTEIKILDKAAGRISAVVSTESVDRDGDIIRQAHWDLDHFKSHPILLSSHNYRGLQNQIGEWTDMKIDGTQLVGEALYYLKQGNAEADWGFVLASKGRAAFSVGFVPDMSKAKTIESAGNMAYEFQGQELLEVSQVTVPSNADALQTLKGIGLHPEIDTLVSEVLGDFDDEITETSEEVAQEIRDTTGMIGISDTDRRVFANQIASIVADNIKGPKKPYRRQKDSIDMDTLGEAVLELFAMHAHGLNEDLRKLAYPEGEPNGSSHHEEEYPKSVATLQTVDQIVREAIQSRFGGNN